MAAGLLFLKAVVAWFTGSVAVLGSALDSALDLLNAGIMVLAVRSAERPADADHPWGHGKAEGLAGLFQGAVIGASGLFLARESVSRLFSEGRELNHHATGMVTMVISIVVVAWLVRRLRVVAEQTGSLALKADSVHGITDILVNLGVIVGLGLSSLLGGAIWPDALVSLLISLAILNTARHVLTESAHNLMDRGLTSDEMGVLLRVVNEQERTVVGFHELRSRRSGPDLFLELHLDLDRKLPFVAAHDLAEQVGTAIEEALPRCRVTVHADPV